MPPDQDFYPSELTDRSRSVLDLVLSEVPDATLIGGWATWARVRGPMSHDIDLIVDDSGVERLRAISGDMSTADHLGGRKWRATLEGIHLGIHVPYQSRLGRRLGLRTEVLIRHNERVDGWNVLTVPAHTATKIDARREGQDRGQRAFAPGRCRRSALGSG